MTSGRVAVSWLAAVAVILLRATCRIRRHGDPRPGLRDRGVRYAYSVLHAHQVAAILDGEPGTGAMVSRSDDGEIIVPSLRARGIVPIRGSSNLNGRDKGGARAYQALVAHSEGGSPVYFAVDGPRGPRNTVGKGIALLSRQTGAVVLNIVAVPTRRWILRRAWDRLQIPKPFSVIDVYFSEPLESSADESVEDFRLRVEGSLQALELRHDPLEAEFARVATRARAEQTNSCKVSGLT